MSINQGELDRFITIEKATTSQDNAGEKVETWSTFAQVWAKKKSAAGDERYSAKQVRVEYLHVYRIGFYPNFDPGASETMRVVDGSQTFGIHSIVEIGRGEGFDIFVKAPV